MNHEDPEYADFVAFCKDMDDLTNRKRCIALAKYVDEHDLLSNSTREISNTKDLIKDIQASLENENDRSQHRCKPWAPKRKIFMERWSDGAPLKKICPDDEAALSSEGFESTGEIERFLQAADKDYRLNLMKITLPDGTKTVAPTEYSRINSGAIGALELTIYGVYGRPGNDGSPSQHTIMMGCTGFYMLSNGPTRNAGYTGPDMMAELLSSQTQGTEAPPTKRQRTDNVECGDSDGDMAGTP
jgi:hypothetical protein